MAALLPAKRKRAQICYAEVEEDSDLEQAIDASACDRDEAPDEDAEYGSRKKPSKHRTRSHKRAKAKSRARATSQKPFRFLDLPGELRDCIYELALVEPRRLTLVSKYKAFRRTVARGVIYARNGPWDRQRWPYSTAGSANGDSDQAGEMRSSLSPNLLAVNKQIHAEAVGYLYKQTIILEDTMALHTFLATIGPANRLHLSSLTVTGWGEGRGAHKTMNVAALTLLAACVNLEKLQIYRASGFTHQPKQLAKQFYRAGHYFLEAYGAANGRRDAAVGVVEFTNWKHSCDGGWVPATGSEALGSDKDKNEFQEQLKALLE